MTSIYSRLGAEIQRPEVKEREHVPFDLFEYCVELTINTTNAVKFYQLIATAARKPIIPNMNFLVGRFYSDPNTYGRDKKRMYSQFLEATDWIQYLAAIEAMPTLISDYDSQRIFYYSFNTFCEEQGIAWKFLNGELSYRGSGISEDVVATAQTELEQNSYLTASSELSNAWRALSQRPTPDLHGAVAKASQAAEAVVKSRLGVTGKTLKSHLKDLKLHSALTEAVDKMWGYASDRGRHVEEEKPINVEEAELSVAFWSAIIVYLMRLDG